MSNAKHTPGPWFYDDSLKSRITINSSTASIAAIPYLDKEAVANARLIAAAPELLAALNAIVFQVFQGSVWERDACITQARAWERDACITQARAAIAKAEAQS